MGILAAVPPRLVIDMRLPNWPRAQPDYHRLGRLARSKANLVTA